MIDSTKRAAQQLPKGWQLEHLGGTMKFVNGYAFKPGDWEEEGLPIIRIQNLNDESASYNYYSGQVDERYYVRNGDILFAWSGTKGVSFGARKWSKDLAILNQHIFRVVPTKVDADFCYHLLKGTQERIERNAHGFKSSFVHVTKGDLEKVSFSLPPLPEQRKIATILTTWDESIQIASQLLESKQLRKRSLMQRLLTGQTRLPGFTEAWWEVKLNQVFKRIKRRNDEGNTNVLTISAQYGLISQTEYFNKVVASEEVRNYYLLHRGEFAYNKSSSAGYDFGAIKRLDLYEKGILSPLYICLAITDGYSDFYTHFFEAGLLNHGIYKIAQEGARSHGLLNISVIDFFQIKFKTPVLSEQRAIAAVLNAVDEEIRLAKEEIEVMQMQKRGLMTQLLTGQILTTV